MTTSVFVGEKNAPVAGYTVTDKAANILTQNETCMAMVSGQQQSVPAYQIGRFQDFTLDPSLSVNTK